MRFAIAALFFAAATTSSYADDTALPFNVEKLCQWQSDNNSMDVAECTQLEEEGKAALAELATKAEKPRLEECNKEAMAYSGDSGFASYTVYATCLKDGPGSL